MKKDGGYAFPHDVEQRTSSGWGESETCEFSDPGMTLRDYFAAKAMNAFVANSAILKTAVRADVDAVAKESYRFADAMLKFRGK